ncbi:MAG: electron transport complex subunit RsxA [Deltaproteobacteria bacterium]|nr:MAG: electron transport complex subunit RsxA [Deltaproteobacteria bacterium]
MGEFLLLMVSAILVNNILLLRFLGNCPFLGVSRKMDTATGMGLAVIFVMTLAGMITWLVYRYLLVPLSLEYLRTIAFILVIATLVQFVEMVIQKAAPPLYEALGIYLPLITTNCAVLGVAIINVDERYDLITAIFFSFASACGFALALVLMAGLRERFALVAIPKAFEGTAIGLVTAGLIALAFSGFAGLV